MGQATRISKELSATLANYSEGARALLGPGGAFELTEATIGGNKVPVFANAPRHLRELYQGGLDHGDKTFIVYEDERYTFTQTGEEVRLAMRGLRALGVQPGDRVGIAMRNYPEWVFAYLAITSMGAVAVAINAWWTGDELIYGIEDSGLTTLFVDRERLALLSPYLDMLRINLIVARSAHTAGAGVQSWAEFVDCGITDSQPPDIDPDAPAMILYTSGSTSKPKGVLSSHRAVIHSILGWEAEAAIARADAGRRQRPPERQPCMIITVPLFHVTGLNGQLLPSLRNGRKVIGMYKWDAEKALAIIEKERVTHFSGVPTMAYELVNSPNYGQYDLSSLRSIGGGGAAMTPKHSQRIKERSSNTRASAAYAMTETNGLAASNAGANLTARPNSCGRALRPLVAMQVVDRDNSPLPTGVTGEICIKGAMNFTEYWNKPEATAETLVDGWIHTGDLGHIDEEGFVYITGRAKEMIIRGGENISCQELEAVIYENTKVAECVVFGMPDDRLGESVATVISVRQGEILTAGDIQSHVSEHLARFKVPQHVIVQKDSLAKTASGKLYKKGIREQVIKRLAG